MTFAEAVPHATTGIRRTGWCGYVWCDETGRFWFIPENGRNCEAWVLYMQDIDGEDWSVVGESDAQT